MRYIDLTKANDNTYRSYAEAQCLLCIAELWQAIQAICQRLTREEMETIRLNLASVSQTVFNATGEQENAGTIETNDEYLTKWFKRISE